VKRFAALALAAVSFAMVPGQAGHTQEVVGTAAVTGAGSTFAYPVISRWWKGYQHWVAGGGDFPAAGSGLDDPPSAPVLDYEPTGSMAGIMRVKDGGVDFGATEMPLQTQELQPLGLVQFPMVIGGIVAVVNLDGVGPGQLKITGPLLADIFLGKVQTWSDPAIKALNPDLRLPDAKITVVHRADGSGTTYNFTNYLAKMSPEWAKSVGSDLLLNWPVGVGAEGNGGVSGKVGQTPNSIGYVEFGYARQRGLSFALVQNRAGRFVNPEARSFQAAAASADWQGAGDFHLLLTDAPGEDAYPIVATAFVLMRKDASAGRTRSALNFFEWVLDKGAGDASSLGYVPLPPELVSQVKAYWSKTLRLGA
jgi:phosphate transport system substrate-binding protein